MRVGRCSNHSSCPSLARHRKPTKACGKGDRKPAISRKNTMWSSSKKTKEKRWNPKSESKSTKS